MRIACPHCQTSYDVTAEAIGAAGRSVRCARCRATWFAAAPTPEFAFQTIWGAEPELQEAESPPPPASEIDIIPPPARGATEPQPHAEGAGVEPVADAPPLIPLPDAPAAGASDASAPQEDVETVAARRAPLAREASARRGGRRLNAPVVILALVAVVAALIAWRAQVVRYAPQTASLFARVGLPVNLRGLAFTDVKVSGETQDGVPVLVLDGTIANVAKGPVQVPRLRFAMRNQTGIEVYAWTALPARAILAPGEALPFRTRLASPPADARDVQVRFFNRRDREAAP